VITIQIAITFLSTIVIEITSAIEITNVNAERPFLPRIGRAAAIMQIAEMDSRPSTVEAPSCRCWGTRSRLQRQDIGEHLSRHRSLGVTYRPWLTTFAPILISFSRRLASDHGSAVLRQGQRALVYSAL
jgi:hypothetical protein